MTILAIETSCDESALALIETRTNNGNFECRVISSLIHSQAELHSAYGGVFPSLAKREHGKNLPPLLDKLLTDSNLTSKTVSNEEQLNIRAIIENFKTELSGQNPDLLDSLEKAQFLNSIPLIDRIAVTEGPGLEPALWVGINFAGFLSKLWSIPIVPVNHMEGHIIGSLLESDKPSDKWQALKKLQLPAVALLISGGHTELVKIGPKMASGAFKYTIIGQTKDDAVGEAFDKTARLLGLSYPGGPNISRLANEARKMKITPEVKLPRPMISSGDLNFSFSGLKTAVLYAVRDYSKIHKDLDDNFKRGLALEFEEAVTEVLDSKLRKAIDQYGAKALIIGGGVSANERLRKQFEQTATEYGLDIFMPSRHVSGDNALMIALAGALHLNEDVRDIKASGTMKLGTSS